MDKHRVSILIGAIILSLPLWKISNNFSPSMQNINLPSSASIKKQVEKNDSKVTVNDIDGNR